MSKGVADVLCEASSASLAIVRCRYSSKAIASISCSSRTHSYYHHHVSYVYYTMHMYMCVTCVTAPFSHFTLKVTLPDGEIQRERIRSRAPRSVSCSSTCSFRREDADRSSSEPMSISGNTTACVTSQREYKILCQVRQQAMAILITPQCTYVFRYRLVLTFLGLACHESAHEVESCVIRVKRNKKKWRRTLPFLADNDISRSIIML